MCQLTLYGREASAGHVLQADTWLATQIELQVENFRLLVFQFRKWLKTNVPGSVDAWQKGKGYDDGLYLTSALLRKMLPRGYTNFRFTKAGEAEVDVVLRGFLKFTGLTAADEDEESKATDDATALGSDVSKLYPIPALETGPSLTAAKG
eukprot:Skav216660  [mRNA]  locus=scaffold930:2092:6192:- [translate_table: standard]